MLTIRWELCLTGLVVTIQLTAKVLFPTIVFWKSKVAK